MVMSSHVCYPALGDPPGLPATFSKRLITDRLRHAMRFAGVILTDDLEMGALQGLGSMGSIALKAVEAGHDLLLFGERLDAAREAFDTLCQDYKTGRLDVRELDKAHQRINFALRNLSIMRREQIV